MLDGSLLPVFVCVLCWARWLCSLAVGAYRSIERGHCARVAMSGYKINQHQDKRLEIPALLINTVGFVKFSGIQLDLCVCAVPFAGFALMAQC